ncbi:MAG: ABC transporter ATP-binding protein, partial [Desulfitobacterium sp.]|nr:ABC transporter ATP-binding protein [Desulfitobacterium sp.]
MILYIDGISFSYGSYPVLNGVNMKVEPGQVVSIVGPNGSGKSTLMRCLTRILKPQKGKVFLDGREISRINSRELAKLMGYVPQSVGEAFSYTVLETVLLGRKPRMDWSVGDQDLEKVAQVLEFMDLEILA